MEVDGVLDIRGGLNSPLSKQIGGGAFTVDYYDPFVMLGTGTSNCTVQSATSGLVSLVPFNLPCYVNAGYMGFVYSASLVVPGTSQITHEHVLGYALYTQQTGTNNSLLSLFTSNSFSMKFQISGTSNYRITYPTTTLQTGYGYGTTSSSGGVGVTGGFTGYKVIHVPLSTLLTPGQYWLGMQQVVKTTNFSQGFKLSINVVDLANNYMMAAPMGVFSTDITTGGVNMSNLLHHVRAGWGCYSEANLTSLPNQIAMSGVTISIAQFFGAPQFHIWSSRSL